MVLNDSLIQNGTALLTNGSINLTVNVIAENLTSKLVTDSSIWYQIIIQGLPVISIIMAFYSIYLLQLQGAKIGLVETPKIELPELEKSSFDNNNIPDTLPIKKLDLFFINSGNRDGILKDVHASIRLEENAKSYLKEQFSVNVKYDNNSDNSDFLIILDKSVGHVFIDYLDLQAIDINKGETFREFNSIKETQNLNKIIDEIFEIQNEKLKDFINFIERNRIFGDLEISYKCTGRKWFKEVGKPEKLNLIIEGEYIETVKNYRKLIKDWDDLPPTNESVISKLIEFLNYKCKPMIERNRETLKDMQGTASLHDNSYFHLLESYIFQYNLLQKWETSKLFSEKLYDLTEKMKNYHNIHRKFLMNPAHYEELNQCRIKLYSQCDEVLNLTNDIIDILKNTMKVKL